MKKAAVLLGFAVLCAGICAVPEAAINAMPVASVTSPKTVSYAKTLQSNGAMSYIGQSDVTSALPLVIKQFRVAQGDTVSVGDVIATVDEDATRSLIESMGQMSSLAIPAANLSTAVSLIPQEISSDHSGRVVSVAGSGTAIQAGNSICSIAGTETIVLTAPVSELYISDIQIGQAVSFTLAAYPDESFTGTISAIADAARSLYNGSVLETVIDVTISPDTFDPRMKAGLTADVCFTLAQPKNICVLSYDAIGQDEGGEYVYVYENDKAIKRKIFTGAEFSDGAEIIKGVTAEELVFISPGSIAENSYIRLE